MVRWNNIRLDGGKVCVATMGGCRMGLPAQAAAGAAGDAGVDQEEELKPAWFHQAAPLGIVIFAAITCDKYRAGRCKPLGVVGMTWLVPFV